MYRQTLLQTTDFPSEAHMFLLITGICFLRINRRFAIRLVLRALETWNAYLRSNGFRETTARFLWVYCLPDCIFYT